MRGLGILLLAIGFLGAALSSVMHADGENLAWNTVEWFWYIGFFTIGVIGIFVLRFLVADAGKAVHKIEADIDTMGAMLGTLVDEITALNKRQSDMNVYDVHGHIDSELVESLNAFVNARESLIHAYGMQPYANLMTEFASAERNINRSWSASADGYVDEVWTCMQRAERQMIKAKELFDSYERELPHSRVEQPLS